MTSRVEFYFDFGSPNAYLAYHALKPIIDRQHAQLVIVPCLLGGIFKETGNQPPMMAFQNVKGKLDYERLEFARYLKKHKLESFKFNPHFPVNTVMMMRAAIVAEMQDRLLPFVETGLKMMWEEGLKLDDPAVFVTALNDNGFDGEKVAKQIQDENVKAKLFENTDNAVKRGVFGVPTFFVDGEMYFGKERLNQIEEQLSG